MARRDHHRWLHDQLEAWRAEGVVDAATAERIAARHPVERGGAPLLLFLGAGFVGVGVIWLVAANLEIEEMGPLQRVVGVAALWLAFVAAAETLRGDRWAPLVAPLRTLAALAYGGVIFQAAQSLQVPAYEPSLVLAWGLGALAYAYAVRGRGPLVVGVACLAGWFVWALGAGGTAVILGCALACPVAVALAALQADDLGGPWRFAGAALGLLALAAASIPEAAADELGSTWRVWAGAAVALALVLRVPTAETLGAAAVAAVAGGLVLIAPEQVSAFGDADVTGAQTAYTLLGIALFLAAAVGVAVAGARRGRPALTNLAYAALLAFLALQSFGLLATLASGALLVLGVGVALLVAGIALDRGRRRLLEEVDR